MPIQTKADGDSSEYKGSSGGVKCLVEGTYLVMLEKAEPKDNYDGLSFVIIGGPQAGKKIFENFYYQSNDGDAEKTKGCERRFLVAARAFGQEFNEGDDVFIDLADHLNRCAIVNYRNTGKYTDNRGKEQERWGFKYGIHPICRESLKELAKVEWDDENIEAMESQALNEFDENGNPAKRLTFADIEKFMEGGDQATPAAAQPQGKQGQPATAAKQPSPRTGSAPATNAPPATKTAPSVKKGPPPARQPAQRQPAVSGHDI